MDRISNLPDEIVCHILSFLSTKEASLTCVLSKRWRNLFAFTTNLRFEEKEFVNGVPDFPRTFIDFLDRVLAVSGNSPVKKFSLNYQQQGSDYTNPWIRNVLSRGVLACLHLDVISQNLDLLPSEVFTCKTLVNLKIGRGFFIKTVPANASLPALKTLFLDRVAFFDAHHYPFETLVSACPVLEELVMDNVQYAVANHERQKWCATVSCPTLQRLTIKYLSNQTPQPRSITFNTPSLTYLEYYDRFAAEAYPIIKLDSLVEAKLDLRLGSINSNPENLIKGLRNVSILNLLSTLETMEVSSVLYSFQEAIPVFKNLFHLTITTESNKCCRTLPLLLKNSPNLKTLVFKGPLHYDEHGEEPDAVCECLSGYYFLLSCRVKVVEITSYRGTILELGQLKHFVEKLPCLELVILRSWAGNKKEKLRLITDLQNLLRPSKCKKFELSFVPRIS